ncbi:MAG: T9SS type A sorting domain-containing protein [Bacteroidetes bacterium]|nr:T9SS type A sorting domain-containing protein [Bacteroidota bacterium]
MRVFLFLICISLHTPCFSQNWTTVLPGQSIQTISADKQNNLYVSTNSRKAFKSTNDGSNWAELPLTLSSPITQFAFDTIGTAGNLYGAAGNVGLVKSSNGGQNWSIIDTSRLFGSSVISIACSKNGILHLATNKGYMRSTNAGNSFELLLSDIVFTSVLVDKDNQTIIYIGSSSGKASLRGFYRSTNGGATFSENLSPGLNCYRLSQAHNGNLYKINASAPDEIDKSTDKGVTWITFDSTPSSTRAIIESSSTNEFFAAGFNGIFRTTNGGMNWVNYNMNNSILSLFIVGNKLFAGANSVITGLIVTSLNPVLISNTDTPVADGFDLYRIYPNPFNPVTKIVFRLDKSSSVSLGIYDMLGNEVKQIENGFKKEGTYEVTFSGENLSSGIYFARLKIGDNLFTKSVILLR